MVRYASSQLFAAVGCATLFDYLQPRIDRLNAYLRQSALPGAQVVFRFRLLLLRIAFMPLSAPTSRRALKHTRTIRVEGFARDDGLWDIDARITDVKTMDVPIAAGIRPAGMPLHDLHLRLTVDTRLTIVAVEAASDAVPYPGQCDTIGPAYQRLVGLNLMHRFRADVKARLGGIAGCTHLTEMAQILPTAAMQALAGVVFGERGTGAEDTGTEKPIQLDRCHALRSDGEAVARYYPRWYVAGAQMAAPESATNDVQ